MAVSIRDAKGSPNDRGWIQSVYRDYLNDLASLNTGLFPVLGEFGHREPDLLARWFADDRSHPLIILRSDQPVGFALVVRPQPPAPRQPQVDYRMSEFFVAQPHRRLGIGQDAATLIFNRFAGTWEIIEFLYNKPAVTFWRSIVSDYTGGKFRESIAHGEVRQVFSSAHRRPAR